MPRGVCLNYTSICMGMPIRPDASCKKRSSISIPMGVSHELSRFGNALKSSLHNAWNMAFARLMAINSPYFDIDKCEGSLGAFRNML